MSHSPLFILWKDIRDDWYDIYISGWISSQCQFVQLGYKKPDKICNYYIIII